MTDIVRIDALYHAIKAQLGVEITDEQALNIIWKMDYFTAWPQTIEPATIVFAGGDADRDAARYAAAKRLGLVTDGDEQDIDAEIAQLGGGSGA